MPVKVVFIIVRDERVCVLESSSEAESDEEKSSSQSSEESDKSSSQSEKSSSESDSEKKERKTKTPLQKKTVKPTAKDRYHTIMEHAHSPD